MSVALLKQYIEATYPHLKNQITDGQYEQIDWIKPIDQTNERMAVKDIELHVQQQRIFARLHFLTLLRQGDEQSYQRFVNEQKEPRLTYEHFLELSDYIQKLTPMEYQALWVATTTSRSPEAVTHAREALHKEPPYDGVDFLATVMTQCPEAFPAAKELLAQYPDARAGLDTMFNTGHFRHMMYVEGGPKMFKQLRQKIMSNEINASSLNLWFCYWLIDISGFRAHTPKFGSEYLTENTYKSLSSLKKLLNQLLINSHFPVLRSYLTTRAEWIGINDDSSNVHSFLGKSVAPRLILARIAAMQRIFTPEAGIGLLNGLKQLQQQLTADDYQTMLNILNPLNDNNEPTPTYGPLLLANLAAESNFATAIKLGLPIYAKGLTAYRKLRSENNIALDIPLNLNDLATKENIQAILKGQAFDVSINPTNGTTKLAPIVLEETLTQTKTVTMVGK